jgi:hypothetical protein
MTTTRRRRSIWPLLSVAAVGLILLLLSVPNLAPAIRAARADGVRGTFVAGHVTCTQHPGHELCYWYGTFRSRDDVRRDVYLYGSGRESLRTGQRVAALDVGRPARVYPPNGSREWIPTTGMLLAGCLMLAPLARAGVHRVRKPGVPDR